MKLLEGAGASRPDGGERPCRDMDVESRPAPEKAKEKSSFLELLSDGIRILLLCAAAAAHKNLYRIFARERSRAKITLAISVTYVIMTLS